MVIAYTIHKIHENVLTFQNLWSTYDKNWCLCLYCHRSPCNHRIKAPISMLLLVWLICFRRVDKGAVYCHLLQASYWIEKYFDEFLSLSFWIYAQLLLYNILYFKSTWLQCYAFFVKEMRHIEMPKAAPKKSICYFQKLEMLLEWNKQNTVWFPQKYQFLLKTL